MTDSEKLDFIINELGSVKSDISNMQSDISNIRSDMSNMQSEISDLKNEVIKTQLHLEDRTDRNIELLAENHSNLIDKLNQAIPAANKNLTYEVKVNYLLDRVSVLEKKVQVLEAR